MSRAMICCLRITRGSSLAAVLMTLFITQVCAKTIRTAIPQANLNYLSIYVAEARGFSAMRALSMRPL